MEAASPLPSNPSGSTPQPALETPVDAAKAVSPSRKAPASPDRNDRASYVRTVPLTPTDLSAAASTTKTAYSPPRGSAEGSSKKEASPPVNTHGYFQNLRFNPPLTRPALKTSADPGHFTTSASTHFSPPK